MGLGNLRCSSASNCMRVNRSLPRNNDKGCNAKQSTVGHHHQQPTMTPTATTATNLGFGSNVHHVSYYLLLSRRQDASVPRDGRFLLLIIPQSARQHPAAIGAGIDVEVERTERVGCTSAGTAPAKFWGGCVSMSITNESKSVDLWSV